MYDSYFPQYLWPLLAIITAAICNPEKLPPPAGELMQGPMFVGNEARRSVLPCCAQVARPRVHAGAVEWPFLSTYWGSSLNYLTPPQAQPPTQGTNKSAQGVQFLYTSACFLHRRYSSQLEDDGTSNIS